MTGTNLRCLEPFEICTIRPPTENDSLTFRLTRNCYWNKCKFCPVYKTGAVFSRRSLDEIRRDIERAKQLDNLMLERGIGIPGYTRADYSRLPGLGGTKFSEEHALETARVINAIAPDFVRLRTLEIFPQTPLEKALKGGEFVECPEEQIVMELRTLISRIQVETELLSDSASNLLELYGNLPTDRNRLLKIIDDYLALSERDKRIFSFNSRLLSFLGQYGGLPEDLNEMMSPYVSDEGIDMSRCPDEMLVNITRKIRSRLMP